MDDSAVMTALSLIKPAQTDQRPAKQGAIMITDNQVQACKRDGVLMVPEVLGPDTLARIRTVVADLVSAASATATHTDVYDLEPGHTPEAPRVRRIKTPHKVHAIFDEVVRSKPVTDILTRLFGPGLRLHGSRALGRRCGWWRRPAWDRRWDGTTSFSTARLRPWCSATCSSPRGTRWWAPCSPF